MNLQFQKVTIILSLLFISTSAQNLTAVFSNAKLPYPTATHSVFYDGSDSIYIMGGHGHPNYLYPISRYSLSSDTIEHLSDLPGLASDSPIQMDTDGNLFYFGGHISNSVIKYSPSTNLTEIVAHHMFQESRFYALKPNLTSNIALLIKMQFEGETSDIGSFDMERNILRSWNISLPTFVRGVMSDVVRFNSRIGYIIHSVAYYPSSIWELDFETFEVKMVSAMLPASAVRGPEAVSDGRSVFLVAGFGNHSQEGILQFDPATGETGFLHVDNWPVKDETPNSVYLDPPKCVYVPNLNRIYYIGGKLNSGESDKIFYVDLNPLSEVTPSPPTTVPPRSTTPCEPVTPEDPEPEICEGVYFALYRHPTNCAGYIVCIVGEFDLFYCPDGFYFDPDLQYCNYADDVDCNMCV